jgi:hypothetical protein
MIMNMWFVFAFVIFLGGGETTFPTTVTPTTTVTTLPAEIPVVTVDLTPRHGVWFERKPDVCFPSDYITILTRLEYGKYVVSVTNWLEKVQQALGVFGSTFDNTLAIQNRVCTTPVENVCPVEGMKNLTKQAAFKRNQIYQLLEEVTVVVDDVTAGFKSFPIDVASSWPNQLARVSIENNVARLPAAYSFSTLVDLTLLDEKDGVVALPEMDAELESRLTQISFQALTILSTLNSLKLVVHNLDQGQFSTELVTYTTLVATLNQFYTNEQITMAAIQFMETTAGTQVYHVREVSTLFEAVLEVKAQVPAPDSWNLMHSYMMHVFPVSRVGYIKELKWKKINTSNMAVLVSTNNASMFLYNPLELNCLSTNWKYCKMCNLHVSILPVNSKCVMDLFLHNKDTECTYMEQDPPASAIYPFSTTKVAVLDMTPGSLVQSCGNQNKVFPLQPATLISLNNTCSYDLIDNGGDLPVLSAFLPRNLKVIAATLSRNIPNIVEDLNVVQQHFKTYGYIYVIAVGSGLLLLCGVLGCFICCRCRRTRRRRQITPDSRTVEQETEDRLLLRPLQPMSTLSSRLTSPRITTTSRGLVIETV